MSIIQKLNTKANVKKSSNQDLPYSPTFPIVARYSGASTLNQTVINLSFSVDTTNTDGFFLFVDGKKLTLGALNDFTFTSVGSDLTSSQVTLNQTLPADLNIEAYKMGFKKETEFLTDNRFVTAYDYLGSGFQGFAGSPQMSPTATVGTPVAGTFYSSIQNRNTMLDLSQDLGARFGIDRIITQNVVESQTEVGPNGERVFQVVNDVMGRIRFCGNIINPALNVQGPRVVMLDTNDFIEVTFYGTGLNILLAHNNTAFNASYSVDGGALTNFLNLTGSLVIGQKNVAPNQVTQVVSGLTLGVHTVKIVVNNANGLNVCGFELLNTASANVAVNAGTGYIRGQKGVSSQNLFAYNSVATGTRGGRVLVYQNLDGTISKLFQAVNATQQNMALADHTNEEIARTYHFREFGSGFASDFSNGTSTLGTARGFTLEDGTTTLSIDSGGVIGTGSNYSNMDVIIPNSVSSFLNFTFVGTGLDIVIGGTAAFTDNYSVNVDGTVITSTLNLSNTRRQKIVSGLPYGTHTVRITRLNAVAGAGGIAQFVVYQPKKPTLPSGGVEIADYNVMATFVANATANVNNISTGVLRKNVSRELTYVGASWSSNTLTLASADTSGFQTLSNVSGDYIEYSFFGTGADIRLAVNTNHSANNTIAVDGILFTPGSGAFVGASSSVYGGVAFNTGTGIMNQNGTLQLGAGLVISGLTLGLHKIRITNNTTNFQVNNCFDVICPVHVNKSNLYTVAQNALPVGSQSLSDNRKFTPVKDSAVTPKSSDQVYGVTVSPTVTSTVPIPMPDMSAKVKTSGGKLEISYSAQLINSNAGNGTSVAIYLNGSQVGNIKYFMPSTNAFQGPVSDTIIVPVAPGFHKVDLYWFASPGTTGTAADTRRNLSVKEI